MRNTAIQKHQAVLRRRIWIHRYLFLMLLPGFGFILLFNYGPIYGLQIAFKEYRIMDGIWNSPWVGATHFVKFFTTPKTIQILRNTVVISLYRMLIGFPAPILFAIMLNEIGSVRFKKIAQTLSYLPHFISRVIIAGIVTKLLSPSTGIVNAAIREMGFEPIFFMVSKKWFRTVLVVTGIWKEIGWSSIIYLAALSGISTELYEAAIVDGATRFQRIVKITIPSLVPVITIILILNMAHILNAGFDQIFNMYNPNVYEIADIIDTFVYRRGLVGMDYSFSAAVGLFKSFVGLALVLVVNAITANIGDSRYGLFQ